MKHAELALAKAGAVTPAPFDFSGHWVNELTSYMDLTVNGAAVTGTYTSAVSSGGGPITMPLSGTVTGDLISFTVNWGSAITAWVGHGVLSNGQPQILTLWHLVLAIDDETNPEEQWKTVMAGADEFTR
ncbi:MAG TPA: avidin/streptavidin family protein [Candidatus Dormibacteraeota bacterium]|nr:avidin/streptavidin family protein [Candidatus Dormibacteraeota bacterium]